MTKLYFITLIEHNDDVEFFEAKLNENGIDYEIEIIGNYPDLVYEFKISQLNRQFVRYIINMHCIPVLNFISN
jgi:hypothetical protein